MLCPADTHIEELSYEMRRLEVFKYGIKHMFNWVTAPFVFVFFCIVYMFFAPGYHNEEDSEL